MARLTHEEKGSFHRIDGINQRPVLQQRDLYFPSEDRDMRTHTSQEPRYNLKGCLITFEGTEGAGKTVVSKMLQKWLEKRHFRVRWTREPTFSIIGRVIEQALERKAKVAEEALALLFAADRANHTKRFIIPALREGYIVLCDRYIYSSLAYQRGGMNIVFKKEWLEAINRYALKPDLVFFLDIDPEEGLRRIGKGQRIHDDRFFEDLETQKLIREAYYDVLKLNKPLTRFFRKKIFHGTVFSKVKALSVVDNSAIVSIDASTPKKVVQNIVCEVTRRFLKFKEIRKKEHRLEPKEFFSVLSN